MIVIDYLSVHSKHGSGQRLHGLSGVRIVLGGLWVFLKLEWNRGHPLSNPTGISQASTSFSPVSIFSSFFASAAASFSVLAVDVLPVFLLYFGYLVTSKC